jgi:D-glycero-alpha-D-manno-heptose-7-phosphate kinase
MIITRSPLRISLGGGGTDLPSYYRRHGGFLIAAAIDKYVYITVHRTFVDDLIVKYSRLERVKSAEELQHPIVREALRLAGLDGRGLEVTSMADIPAGTGLGSSGSFTTALVKALNTLTNRPASARELAEQSCHIEIDRLGEPVGKQDQYIAALGGVTGFEFRPDDSVEARPLALTTETLYNLEDNLLLFFTGYNRAASDILREQDDRTRRDDAAMIENLHVVKALGRQSRDALEAGDLREFGSLMARHWDHKKRRGGLISNERIDRWYDVAMQNGALGGKLIGAGGGGFLMFYAEEKMRLRHAMGRLGLPELRFRFDVEGSKVVVQ